ncbi:MAG: HD domain-containing protein, partial [Acidobacteriia bacterium]|nr:HD domain-containing protein [Terriglobia bacterium]
QAIQLHAPEIALVYAERIREELTKLLTEGAARRGFELLESAALLPMLLPEIARMPGVEQPPQFHPEGDVWIHTRMMLEELPAGASPTLAWGVLLHDVGKPPTFRSAADTGDRIRFDGHVETGALMAAEICARLKFSGDDTAQIVSLVANHLRFKDVVQMRPSTLKRFVRLPRFDEHLELHRLDCISSHRQLEAYHFVRRFLEETPPEQVRPQRLLTGEDLKQLGYKPGPLFAKVLAALEDAQLEGQITSREEAVRLVRQSLGKPGD